MYVYLKEISALTLKEGNEGRAQFIERIEFVVELTRHGCKREDDEEFHDEDHCSFGCNEQYCLQCCNLRRERNANIN